LAVRVVNQSTRHTNIVIITLEFVNDIGGIITFSEDGLNIS